MIRALIALALLSGCITTAAEGDAMKRDIAALKGEIAKAQQQGSDARLNDKAKLEELEKRLGALEGTLQNLRQADADVGVQLDKVVAEVQTLRGEIEQARHDLTETTLSVKDILARPPPTLTTGEKAPIEDANKTKSIGGQEVPADAKKHYEMAKKLYDEKKYAESGEAFDLWMQRHAATTPESADNAAFWKAESYFGQAGTISDAKAREKSLKQAILAYQRVIENPKSGKHDVGLYKIGMSFEQLGLKEEAAAFYEEVIEKHPKSSFAKEAKNKLKALGVKDKKGKKGSR